MTQMRLAVVQMKAANDVAVERVEGGVWTVDGFLDMQDSLFDETVRRAPDAGAPTGGGDPCAGPLSQMKHQVDRMDQLNADADAHYYEHHREVSDDTKSAFDAQAADIKADYKGAKRGWKGNHCEGKPPKLPKFEPDWK